MEKGNSLNISTDAINYYLGNQDHFHFNISYNHHIHFIFFSRFPTIRVSQFLKSLAKKIRFRVGVEQTID